MQAAAAWSRRSSAGSALTAEDGRLHGNEMPKRAYHRHPAHPPPIRRHNAPVILHVTICTNTKGVLDNPTAHSALVRAWSEAAEWRTGEYVIMPDHVHFFCAPGRRVSTPIRRWTGYWKRVVGEVEPTLKRVFQEDCWDTQMRSREHYNEKLSYIRRNPERKDLVNSWREWPFRGHVFDVHWH